MHQLIGLTLTTAIAVSCVYTHDEGVAPEASAPCGGLLEGPAGVLQTPGFPRPFPTPIRCRWVISNPRPNGTVAVYFTQQFTTTGLSFTEYLYYDESYRAGERRVLVVTDDNINKVKWLQVTSPFLVVEFALTRLEGTQLRALGLLNVHGFNMTYEVRAAAPHGHNGTEPSGQACSALECRFLGHCYATSDYSKFYCACFDGYFGADCGIGPLCPRNSATCRNGGTCRQIGPATVNCMCTPHFTGDLCEMQLSPPECGEAECSEDCKGSSCDCNPQHNDSEGVRFDTLLQINLNVSRSDFKILSKEVVSQLTSYLKGLNITLEDDILITNISKIESEHGGVAVHVRIWGLKKETLQVRTILARLASRSRLGKYRLVEAPLHFVIRPALELQSLSSNSKSSIWEGAEFILTCIVQGSPTTEFIWYKDGVKVDFGKTDRDIYTRTVAEDSLGRRTSLLGVTSSKVPDTGTWSCVATDAGRRRCRALRVMVVQPPQIRFLPPTLTIKKGENATITCLASASGRIHGILGFSWARERTLLPLAPGREVWEDLYPTGSVLHLYNVQKSSEYQCQVASVAGTNAAGVSVWVSGGPVCHMGAAHGLRWASTAPGTWAYADCPRGYQGKVSRFCEIKNAPHHVEWLRPDFSLCHAEVLTAVYEEFVRISYGYSKSTMAEVSQQYVAQLRSLPALPGSGTAALTQAIEMLNYAFSPLCSKQDRVKAAKPFAEIFDALLIHEDAFLDEEKIFQLQNALTKVATLSPNTTIAGDHMTIKKLVIMDESDLYFHFPLMNHTSQNWHLIAAAVNINDIDRRQLKNESLVAIHYSSLIKNLPSLRRTAEFKDGEELEYVLVSDHVQISLSVASSMDNTVLLTFKNVANSSTPGSRFVCGLRSALHPGAWNTNTCDVIAAEHGLAQCLCRGTGSYGLLRIARSVFWDHAASSRSAVSVALCVSAALCVLSACAQLPAVVRHLPTSLLLRVVFCVAEAVAFMAMLHCNIPQSTCSLGWSWSAQISWSLSGASLAAQPLLLQAELAGRVNTQLPIVALLAGVCILILLTAHVAGGAPLQVGTGAQVTCAVGSALVTALCLALIGCAAHRLHALATKIPHDKRNFVKKRMGVLFSTLILLVSSKCFEVAGMAYTQKPQADFMFVISLPITTAVVSGVAVLMCYVIRDHECLQNLKNLITLNFQRSECEPDHASTSLSLFIKHKSEAESSGESRSPAVQSALPPSGVPSYWRAPQLESPAHLQRRLSNPDCRADIVRCVEFKHIPPLCSSAKRYNECDSRQQGNMVAPARSVCDLIPGSHSSQQPEYMTRVCVELGILGNNSKMPQNPNAPILTCSVDFEPYPETKYDIDSAENCKLCTKSTPDISKPPPAPMKSCLKKKDNNIQLSQDVFKPSRSMPSIEIIEQSEGDESVTGCEVRKKTNVTNMDGMLNQISSDLDFLLNRTPDVTVSKINVDVKSTVLEKIQEEQT